MPSSVALVLIHPLFDLLGLRFVYVVDDEWCFHLLAGCRKLRYRRPWLCYVVFERHECVRTDG